MKYVNTYGVIAFTHEGKDYISNKGETVEMPKTKHVDTLLKKGYIQKIVKQKKQKKL